MTEAVSQNICPVATGGYGYRDGQLHCGEVSLQSIATTHGTPCYVYDGDGIRARYRAFHGEFSGVFGKDRVSVHYAVKANSNVQVLGLLASEGAGMDVVSVGELERAWLAGVPMSKVCMAGVAKGDDELRAAMDGRFSPLAGDRASAGRDPSERGCIGLINVESVEELDRVSVIAREVGARPKVALRVNPAVVAGAHDHVRVGGSGSKFGISPDEAVSAAAKLLEEDAVSFAGLHMHIGSQIDDLDRFDAALAVLCDTAKKIEAVGQRVRVFDVGAGAAVSYMGESAPSDAGFAEVIARRLRPWVAGGASVIVEPGREIVAQAGVLLARVRHVKRSDGRIIVIVDAGLNALVRPAMYGARHMVWPIRGHLDVVAPPTDRSQMVEVDVVGPVCESSDVLLTGWSMPEVERGDVLAVFTAGAYGMSMAMTFNDQPLPAEILVESGHARVIRPRQSMAACLGLGGQG